jgi:hypothetical protein
MSRARRARTITSVTVGVLQTMNMAKGSRIAPTHRLLVVGDDAVDTAGCSCPLSSAVTTQTENLGPG